jgi:SHS2 domain-containing protein
VTLQVQAPSLLELFQTTAHQIFNEFIDPAEVGQALREKIAIEAKNEEGLLSEWVIMLLELIRYNRMVAREFKITLNTDAQSLGLKSEVLGELIDVQRHVLKREPMLARCKRVSLRQEAGHYIAEIVLLE